MTGDEAMSEVLNNYFASVFTHEGDGPVPEEDDMESNTRLQDITITAEKVKEKIKKLRPSAAPGPDKIGPGLLQHLSSEVAPALTIIYKKSLESGIVPEDWRVANVTPPSSKRVKSGSLQLPSSISNICLL